MFEDGLRELTEKGLLREVVSRASSQGRTITIGERQCINFASNDYLGFASNPEIGRAAAAAIERFGFGSGASRLLAGGSAAHEELEEEVARFKRTGRAILFNSGYDANTGIIPSITSGECVIFSDELNHASIVDGCRLSRAKVVVYRHKDVLHLETLLSREKGRKVVITDSVFSMDGDIAPIPSLHELCGKYNALLYIDDAHGTGVLGGGAGALEHFGIMPGPRTIQVGTFSKALGSFGAFAAADRDIIEWISNTARSFMFSTALPACIVSASHAALRMLGRGSSAVKRLWENRERLAEGLRGLGLDTMESETPIVPVRAGGLRETIECSRILYEQGVYAPAVRPPAVREPRIRLTVSASHTDEDIDLLVSLFEKIPEIRPRG